MKCVECVAREIISSHGLVTLWKCKLGIIACEFKYNELGCRLSSVQIQRRLQKYAADAGKSKGEATT